MLYKLLLGMGTQNKGMNVGTQTHPRNLGMCFQFTPSPHLMSTLVPGFAQNLGWKLLQST